MVRPRKENALDIHKTAITAAIELLATKQTSKFSLAELAKQIGCSAPALYNHFSNKNNLLKEVRIAVFEQALIKKKVRYEIQNTDPLMQLKNGGLNYINSAKQNPALYKLVYCPPSDLFAKNVTDNIYEQSIKALAKGISECQMLGYAKNYKALELANMLWASVHGAALFALDQQQQIGEATAWENANAVVENIIQLIKNTKS